MLCCLDADGPAIVPDFSDMASERDRQFDVLAGAIAAQAGLFAPGRAVEGAHFRAQSFDLDTQHIDFREEASEHGLLPRRAGTRAERGGANARVLLRLPATAVRGDERQCDVERDEHEPKAHNDGEDFQGFTATPFRFCRHPIEGRRGPTSGNTPKFRG